MDVDSTLQVLTAANEILAAHAALILRVKAAQQARKEDVMLLHSPPRELRHLHLIATPSPVASPEESPPPSPAPIQHPRPDLPPAKRARMARYRNYVPEEETIRNDYSQRYVDGGEWPQNWVLGAEPERRFEEYPKQQRLLTLKKASVNAHSLPPSFLPFSDLTSLHPSKFDVILIDPPFNSTFTWDHLQELAIPSLAGDPSFVFLWVGSGAGEGLERGREVLAKWGYRRCEDVVWVKTNKRSNQGPGTDPPTTSIFTRTKQHCLMGIRGTVRRSTDSWFVHCNVDTDVILWEGDPTDPTRKPPEMYTLIENFCLGLRRLEVFGKRSSLRRGWVTVLAPGQEEGLSSRVHVEGEGEEGGSTVASAWVQHTWDEGIKELSATATGGQGPGKPVVPMTPEIDTLRPKSPTRSGQQQSSGGHVSTHSSGGGPMMGAPAPRFAQNNRGGGMNQMMGAQNHGHGQMMVPSMMGMNAIGMGMDEMMGSWNPMMGGGMGLGMNGMGGGTRGMGVGMGMGGAPGMGGMMPMHIMNQMAMGGMSGFQGMNGFGVGGAANVNGGWNDPNQYAAGGAGAGVGGGGGMDGNWDEGGGMQGMMGNGMNPMGGMGLGQNWGNTGNF